MSASGARDILDGLRRLANCEAIAEYEPGYINREFAARQKLVRGLLERNTAWLETLAASGGELKPIQHSISGNS